MKAWARDGRFVLEEVEPELERAVAELAFAHEGPSWVRAFPADAPHCEAAERRFVECARTLVRQTAGLEPVPWAETLETLVERTGTDGWWLVGSGALAVRGAPVSPRDLDLISDATGCERLADSIADLLVEPLADGGFLGTRWLRAFGSARIECVGGVHASVDDGDEPSDFGPLAATRLETVEWRGHALRMPPLELQLRVSERRGLAGRAQMIRELMR
jgi:hypothetical protein